MITIQQAINNFKELIESAIKDGGGAGKTSMIRSSKPIMNIHDAVKSALINKGINSNLIFPPLYKRTPELKLAGALKQKDQDICIIPNDLERTHEILQNGLLRGVEDIYGEQFTRHTLVINVRSQISSIQKNFDTLYERTISEAQNLHDRCPDMVLGEVYLIAVPEYNDADFDNKKCSFKRIDSKLVEKYIKSFKAITNRNDKNRFFYQYEAACLLIVDFSRPIPKIYNTTAELKSAGLLPLNSTVDYEGLNWDNFLRQVLSTYNDRFCIDKLS